MPEITIYTRTTCAPCRAVKHWLKSKGFVYTEKNVDEDPSHIDMVLKQTGMQMVPVTIVNGETVLGLNLSRLSQLLVDN